MPKQTEKPQLKIVIVGHVDHGKSTLVGRLLQDAGMLPEGKLEEIKAGCAKRGMPFEWSFLMDALQIERNQGITIDTTQIWLRADDKAKKNARDIVIIDAPGHKEFLKNMITGAAQADAALVLIDAKEGIREQSRRHGFLLHLLGVRQIAVLVNKMDLVGYDAAVFRHIEREYRSYLMGLGVEPTCFIPICARGGDNVMAASPQMKWYRGHSVIEALKAFEAGAPNEKLPLRFPIQDVYKFDARRILAGRIESGSLNIGDALLFSPSGTEAKVASIETWPPAQVTSAQAGQSIGITLDEPVFVERGQVASQHARPPILTNRFRARIFWLGKKPLEVEKRYKIRLDTCETIAEVREIEHVIDADTLEHVRAIRVERSHVAEVIFRTKHVIAVDDFADNPRLGRFVIIEDYDVVGGGTISMEGFSDQRQARSTNVKSQHVAGGDYEVDITRRALKNGHLGGILWFTGLSGAGKSTIAERLQKRLFEKGYQVFVLDGDHIRKGLSRDLGFSPQERSEHIRRLSEVAALFAQAGMIVIVALISPYREDRRRARAIASDQFHTVYIKASLETCEKRDVKGLYKKARAGSIAQFTGVSAPYEAPQHPDLTVDTEKLSVEESVKLLLHYIDHQLVEPVLNIASGSADGRYEDAGIGI